jgi:AraC family transcriptional regulator, regulatory protein of adaptative response / methylphosphotriester-DNA alkyltransferase methyltransferase
MKIPQKILARQHEIVADFLQEIDKHLSDIVEGKTEEMLEVKNIADILCIHPTHLSNTIKLATGKPPCYFYEEKILGIAKSWLEKNEMSIHEIAVRLTYDPSNFTKFFKRFTGQTPKQYRETFLSAKHEAEMLTI